ncbi:helix-turn-helix domain-containing protein [Rhizobium sp.]|jgi:DNA-binding transcriptional MerR regulator|uniref:MerR family transcriptional regulator n=1 Tax=Rhizobium sp. TaxID=391 RepID=UPI000E7E67D6|nr:MerR family transcriptional regulator [Rhizobium sp.]
MYSIGELSKRAGVKVPTIRYYEQMGLMPEPERSDGNQRRYSRQQLERLSFIRHARDLGFNIEAIRDLIGLSGHPEQPCTAADQIAAEHLQDVRRKIIQLKKLESELERIVSNCAAHTVEQCYVLRSLSDHKLCDHDHQ